MTSRTPLRATSTDRSATPEPRPDARRQRRAPWFLLVLVALALAGTMLVHGYGHHMVGSTPDGEAPSQGRSGSVPRAAVTGGPILDVAGSTVRTTRPRGHRIALTFDDGPDPVWTPQILDVLHRYGVHATFFGIGSQVARNPGLVREIRAEGHELGIHTFTHVDLGTVPEWRRFLEMHNSQLVLAGAAEITTPLLRPPYSSDNSALDDRSWTAVATASADRYVTVLSTLDTEDWRRPGVGRIVANGTPRGSAGQILLLHDGGGDRSETVRALDVLLPRLKAQGFQFDTVSQVAGLPVHEVPASLTDRLQGMGVIAALWVSDWAVTAVLWALIAIGCLSLLRAVGVLIAALRHARRSRRRPAAPAAARSPIGPVSVVLPAYNERAGIVAAVRSVLASDHPVEVIVVDDGSTDGTADLVEGLGLTGVRVIRQPNSGKATALNAGILAASHDVVVMMDGDTVLDPRAIGLLARRFEDPVVGAVSGNAKVANRRRLLGRWQHIEYVVSFNLDRRLFDLAECMPTVPGAIGAFRRSALHRVGGVSSDTLAEDTDLTMSLCRDGWRVQYEERALAWTEAPEAIGALWRQRYRWCYGTLQAMWKHRSALRQRGPAGKLGRRGLTYLLGFQVVLPLFGPFVDVFALYGLLFLDAGHVVAVWLSFLLLQVALGLFAFRLDREAPAPLVALPLQQLVYRQMMYLVVIQSVITAVAGARLRWQRVERYGSVELPRRLSGAGPASQ